MGLQFHDCFMTGLAREMDVDRQAYQPAAVYINGQYWGLLNVREKISEHYVEENHRLEADSVNLLESNGVVVKGSNKDYRAITDYLNVKTSLQNNSDYNWVQDKIELDNFIQYQLTEIYLNNRDWPGNNIKFWNTTSDKSKWRWILYDTDFGFGIYDNLDYQLNSISFALEPNGPNWPNPPWSTLLLRRLVTNTGFRNNFINQFCDRLNQDFLPQRINTDLDSLANLYQNEMVNTFSRWWGNIDQWRTLINNRKTFGANRPYYCRLYLQSAFNLGEQLKINIQVSPVNQGYVKLNSIYPKSFPFSGIYFKNVPVTITAIPKPGYKFIRWEGSINDTQSTISYNMNTAGTFTAVFAEANEEDLSVIINEINYNSSDTYNTKDWVEIYNNGLTTVDLTGWMLTDSNMDSAYVFSEGTMLEPGKYLVICHNIKDFRNYNPQVKNSTGNMLFGLSSSGDIVRLFDNNNQLIDAVNYGVFAPWPQANGNGNTMELQHPGLDNALPANWQALVTGGSPGCVNTNFSEPVTVVSSVPAENSLLCFPNPFRTNVTISFTVISAGHYQLEIFDQQGKIIACLADAYLNQGEYWIDWTGNGQTIRNGVYTVRLIGNSMVQTAKLVKAGY